MGNKHGKEKVEGVSSSTSNSGSSTPNNSARKLKAPVSSVNGTSTIANNHLNGITTTQSSQSIHSDPATSQTSTSKSSNASASTTAPTNTTTLTSTNKEAGGLAIQVEPPTDNPTSSSPAPPLITMTDEDGHPLSIRADAPLSSLTNEPLTNPFGERFKASNDKLTVDDFDLLAVVGKGSFGKVMQVRQKKTGKIYAMKVLKKETLVARKQVAHTKTERKILEEIQSPFIVGLKFAFQTDNKLYMILEYFPGGELFYHLKTDGRFSEERARFYAAEIVLALECLHQHTIAYRDLKPENVLLDSDGHVRLTDFGLSKEGVTRTNLTKTFCGTPEYLAPEVVQGQMYGLQVDWWSLGTILYEMLTGLPPFYNVNLHIMYERIVRAVVNYPPYLSASAKSILSALLERDPEKRLGAKGDAADVKAHPYFAGLDWDKLAERKLKPSFVPTNNEGKLDTSNIDKEFTAETPRDTPILVTQLNTTQQVQFPGFTYEAPASVGLKSSELEKNESQW